MDCLVDCHLWSCTVKGRVNSKLKTTPPNPTLRLSVAIISLLALVVRRARNAKYTAHQPRGPRSEEQHANVGARVIDGQPALPGEQHQWHQRESQADQRVHLQGHPGNAAADRMTAEALHVRISQQRRLDLQHSGDNQFCSTLHLTGSIP